MGGKSSIHTFVIFLKMFLILFLLIYVLPNIIDNYLNNFLYKAIPKGDAIMVYKYWIVNGGIIHRIVINIRKIILFL